MTLIKLALLNFKQMKLYTFTITGMTCHSCESLIKMDLEDAGLPAPESFNTEIGKMTIQLDESQVEEVKRAVESSDKYKISSID